MVLSSLHVPSAARELLCFCLQSSELRRPMQQFKLGCTVEYENETQKNGRVDLFPALFANIRMSAITVSSPACMLR